MDMDEILQEIALENGVTVEEVKKDMEQAIAAAYSNQDTEVRKNWDELKYEEKPTVEQFVKDIADIVSGHKRHDEQR